jgi:signal transduction histidine kinase
VALVVLAVGLPIVLFPFVRGRLRAAADQVKADLAPTHATIEVVDDGVGIDEVAARSAIRRGRMGIPSMAQRARLIGADFAIEPRQPGTCVRVRWAA